MAEAIEEARKGICAHHGGPFGAVIVKGGKVVGRGHNRVLLNNDATCHGEMEAIRDASKALGTFDLSGCEIYTTGEPCPMCLGAILWANISKIYYGCNTVDTDGIGFRDERFYTLFQDHKSVCQELDREACLKLYEEYLSLDGNQGY
ncbi:MAG: nucleoside deaminase [Bacilli bacterium]|nr:nucleoside deaminase [Bacilli bacterium]